VLEKIDLVEKEYGNKLAEWLKSQFEEDYSSNTDSNEYTLAKEKLIRLFGSRLSIDTELLNMIKEWLQNPGWSTRLGAVRVLIHWPGNIPKEILHKILESLNDNRGLESYPARLNAASYLINRDPYCKEAIQLGMEALEYGTLPWEHFQGRGTEVRKQAALMLGTLEPVHYDQVVYDKLIYAMKTEQNSNVRDTLYATLVKLAGMRSENE
jgi:hypothetical protein